MKEADPKCLEGLRVDLLTHYQCAMLQLLIPPLSRVEHDHTYSKFVCQEPGTCTNYTCRKRDSQLTVNICRKIHVKRELNVTILECQKIEHSTRQQSHSQLWHQVRARRIKCGRILCMKHYTENLSCILTQ